VHALLETRGRVLQLSSPRALGEAQAAVGEGVSAVCLVGDAQELPFVELADPCGYDELLLTDAPWGMTHTPDEAARLAGELVPLVPVSRLPSLDPAKLRRWFSATPLASSWQGGVAVCAAVWERAARGTLERIGAKVEPQLAPPADRRAVEAALTMRPGRVFMNVHGTDQDAVWLGEGEGGYPEVLRAPGAAVGEHGVVVSEACYGATLADGEASIAPSFLAAGAGCFVGSTIIAWGGGPGSPPVLADDLAGHFFAALDRGRPAAWALHEAKLSLLLARESSGAGISPPLHNTLLSFVCYGDPLAVTGAAAAHAPMPQSQLAAVRQQLQQRLGTRAWRIISSSRLGAAALAAPAHALAARRLSALLGSPLTEARRFELADAGRISHTCFLAESTTPTGRRHAGIELDAHGRELSSYVSR
jgi:hypothetical protein